VQFSDARLVPYAAYFIAVYASCIAVLLLIDLALYLLKMPIPMILKVDSPIHVSLPAYLTARRFRRSLNRYPNRREYWCLVLSMLVLALAMQWLSVPYYFFRRVLPMSGHLLTFMLVQLLGSFAFISIAFHRRHAKRMTVSSGEMTP
jgi:hypothetical protein